MNIRKLSFLVFFGLLIFTSCSNDENSEFQSTEINFTEIGKGALFGSGQEGISQSKVTISNMSDWQNLISQMDSVNNVSENFTETDINFNEFIVFAIFLEVKGNGWEIGTENVIENQNNITIITKETEFANSLITQPFSIVKIHKTDKIIIVE